MFLKNIDYSINLYYSYLLPLFDIYRKNHEKIFIKKYGYCSGLKCFEKNTSIKCFIPKKCSVYSELIGIDKKYLINKLVNYLEKSGLKIRYINKFTLIHSSFDKTYVFLSIYLSRNTDYYRNTVKWIKTIINNNCIEYPLKCLNYIKSYQYRELLDIWKNIVLNKTSFNEEINTLFSLKGFGLKSINAYLLHVYGYTKYAPIDRHYYKLLNRIGLNGLIPSKEYCIDYKLNCSKCRFNNNCLYNIVYNKFGLFNGIIQSINYVYSRLKNIVDYGIKLSNIEEKVIGDIVDKYIGLIDEFEEFTNLLTSIDKFNID